MNHVKITKNAKKGGAKPLPCQICYQNERFSPNERGYHPSMHSAAADRVTFIGVIPVVLDIGMLIGT